jgi:DNA processing protein
MNYNTIIPDKHKFLQGLANIAKVPERLYFRGELPAERISTVAIVGTRKPTAYGREVTYKIAYELAQRGVVIISGLAFGIDSIAHRAALDAGGITIAVLGNGIDTVYPRAHEKLAQEILQKGGALLSEYPQGAATFPSNFLARNRLVSGLADAVVVTEAAARSGSLATVNHALEQGKDVFAVPGNITNPMSAGCNEIIKQGATPLTDPKEVLPGFVSQQISLSSSNPILKLMEKGIRDSDELMKQSGMSASDFLQAMTLLEIDGVIRSNGGNKWTT